LWINIALNTFKRTLIYIDTEDEKNIFFKREKIGDSIPFGMESLGR
jgi:hypothetical protein